MSLLGHQVPSLDPRDGTVPFHLMSIVTLTRWSVSTMLLVMRTSSSTAIQGLAKVGDGIRIHVMGHWIISMLVNLQKEDS